MFVQTHWLIFRQKVPYDARFRTLHGQPLETDRLFGQDACVMPLDVVANLFARPNGPS